MYIRAHTEPSGSAACGKSRPPCGPSTALKITCPTASCGGKICKCSAAGSAISAGWRAGSYGAATTTAGGWSRRRPAAATSCRTSARTWSRALGGAGREREHTPSLPGAETKRLDRPWEALTGQAGHASRHKSAQGIQPNARPPLGLAPSPRSWRDLRKTEKRLKFVKVARKKGLKNKLVLVQRHSPMQNAINFPTVATSSVASLLQRCLFFSGKI